MLKIILLGAAAVALALVADTYAVDPNLAQAVSPYAMPAPIYAPAIEGRAAYVDHKAQPAATVVRAQASAAAPNAR